MSKTISAYTARTQFGQILKKVEEQRLSYIVERRGQPKAIILSLPNYIKLAAPEPEVLKIIGEASVRRGTDKMTVREIDAEIKATRRERRKNAHN